MTSTSRAAGSREAGFSLIELMVAMMITLIVSGAIYGLIASGQGAFRREPALSDRQQNIRAAMDRIVRDVSGAGLGMHPWSQIFTNGLSQVAAGRESEPRTPALTDQLEVLTDESGSPSQEVCSTGATTVDLKDSLTSATVGQVVLLFLSNGQWTARKITAPAPALVAGGPGCAGPGQHIQLTFAAGGGAGTAQAAFNTAAGVCSAAGGVGDAAAAGCTITHVSFGEAVGYRIWPPVLNQDPFLERRSTANTADGAANAWAEAWQQIAPGIEDLQVLYWSFGLGVPSPDLANPALLSAPGPLLLAGVAPTQAEMNNRIRQVQIMISGRTMTENLAGMSDPKGRGRGYVRGQLTSTVVIPATLDVLSRGSATTSPSPQFR